MTDDFVTRLGHALREAADREERRGSPARVAAAARATLPRVQPSPILAVLTVGAVLVAAVYLVTTLQPEPARPPAPEVVARLAPANALDQVVSGFGSAWLVDTDRRQLVRMDPARRRVTARIAMKGDIAVAVGDDVLWVGENEAGVFHLLRIDPATNHIVARIRLPKPSGGWAQGGFPVALGGAVWVFSPEGAVRVDQATNRVTTAITIARSGYSVGGATVLGDDLWALVSNGRLLRFDGRTGRREAAVRAPFAGMPAAVGGALLLADDSQVARLDPATGRVLWRTRIDHIGPGAVAGGLLWAEAADRGGDRVVAVDPGDGRVVSSVHVGEFGAQWMERVGSELWMTTAGGHVVILRP